MAHLPMTAGSDVKSVALEQAAKIQKSCFLACPKSLKKGPISKIKCSHPVFLFLFVDATLQSCIILEQG
jgi:hypothetical protein